MALMVGGAPFGHRPAGTFNVEIPREGLRYLEPTPRRIRGVLGGETVVDSTGAYLLHRHGYLAVWCFPVGDVHTDLAQDAGDGLVHVPFDALDEWYEEDERVQGHARDPFSRIDVCASSRRVKVSLDGVVLAESTSAKALFETSLPTRWYLPKEAVRLDRLTESAQTSRCAYKGLAAYYDADGHPSIAWTYADPEWDAERVRDMVCFFSERTDIEVDGVMQERPRTPWSGTDWIGRPAPTGGIKDFG